jgi:glycosyltransferase involved in cell wall biosynthesis
VKTKVLIVTQSPVLPTGMAETTRLIFGALLDNYPEKYELYQLALTHSFAITEPRWPVYPTKGIPGADGRMHALDTGDLAGEKSFPELVLKIAPDIVFAFNDPQRLLYLCDPPERRKHKLILYTNIDGIPFLGGAAARLNNADLIVTMSAFARDALLATAPMIPPEKVIFIYSPADTERFKPPLAEEKAALRRKLLPAWMPRDAFVLGWVGRNQWRKQNWLLYKAIHHLRAGGYLLCHHCGRVTIRKVEGEVTRLRSPSRATPESESRLLNREGVKKNNCRHCQSEAVAIAAPLSNVFLWLHTLDAPQNAWSHRSLEEYFDLRPGRDIHYTEDHKIGTWKSLNEIAALYQTWDALLYLSGGEGFGIPAWEAMCSGLPVVYTNYSSHAELLNAAGAGLPVTGMLQPEPGTCIFRMIADLEQVIEAVRRLFRWPELRRKLGGNASAYTSQFRPEDQARVLDLILEARK